MSVLALAAALLPTTAIADDAARYREIITWYEEHPVTDTGPFSAVDRQRVLLAVFKAATSKAVAQTGPVSAVRHIDAELDPSVNGDDPPCGDGSATDDDVVGKSFAAGGGVMATVAISTGGTGAAAVAGIGVAMAIVGLTIGAASGKHSQTANCGTVNIVLPGSYTLSQAQSVLEAHFQDAPGQQFRTGDFDASYDWARVADVRVEAAKWKIDARTDFGKALLVLRGGALIVPKEPPTCPETMVSVRVKNWSNTRDRSFYLTANINKGKLPDDACLDVSYIDKDELGAEYVAALGPEVLQEYNKWVADQIGKRVKKATAVSKP